MFVVGKGNFLKNNNNNKSHCIFSVSVCLPDIRFVIHGNGTLPLAGLQLLKLIQFFSVSI